MFIYRNLVQSAKQFGFVKSGKGRPTIEDLETFLMKNMNRVEPRPLKPKRGYNSGYYNKLMILSIENGFSFDHKVGKREISSFIEFLESQGVELPEEEIVINQHRRKLSECKTEYDRLLFRSKSLGYRQARLGKPSMKMLKEFLKAFDPMDLKY